MKKYLVIWIIFIFIGTNIFSQSILSQNINEDVVCFNNLSMPINDIELKIMGTYQSAKIGIQNRETSMTCKNKGPDKAFIYLKYIMRNSKTGATLKKVETKELTLEINDTLYSGFWGQDYGICFVSMKVEVIGWGNDDGIYIVKYANGICLKKVILFFKYT